MPAKSPEAKKRQAQRRNERSKRVYAAHLVRVYQTENDKLEQAAQAAGLSISAYINALLAEKIDGFRPMRTFDQNRKKEVDA